MLISIKNTCKNIQNKTIHNIPKLESADKNVATVENGKITAVGTTGSTTITAKVEGTEYEATCKVSIVQKVTSITAKNVTVGKNQTAKIEVITTPTGLVEDLTYASETPSIATVAEDGTVTGVATGSATITIKGKPGLKSVAPNTS